MTRQHSVGHIARLIAARQRRPITAGTKRVARAIARMIDMVNERRRTQ